VNESLHPSAPDHLLAFITAPEDTDVLMVAVGIVHAMLLRIQALLLPIKTLVLSGH
jgi:hypothetical protein